MFHEWILREAGVDSSVHFLERDESYTLFGSIECGLHGDDGPNGSRGTTGSLTKIGRKVNKGHDHTAAIMDGVYSAGACARRFSYMSGPSGLPYLHLQHRETSDHHAGQRLVACIAKGLHSEPVGSVWDFCDRL